MPWFQNTEPGIFRHQPPGNTSKLNLHSVKALRGYGGASPAIACCLLLALISGCSSSQKVAEPAPSVSGTEALLANLRIARWKRLIEEQQALPIEEQLVSVNEFFNELAFVDDMTHWGKEDYWATPEEMLATGGGDCEDFSLAKYFTLKQMKVPEERMRLMYVESLLLKQPHMVLSYYPAPTDEPLVLDNIVRKIVPASQRPDLVPIYSFNTEGLWLAKQRGVGQWVGDSTQYSLWQEFLARMQQGADTD